MRCQCFILDCRYFALLSTSFSARLARKVYIGCACEAVAATRRQITGSHTRRGAPARRGRHAVEELGDIKIDHPVRVPASPPTGSQRVERGTPRAVPVRVWMEDRLDLHLQYTLATTVCATRSATVGTPNILVPAPCALGISTAHRRREVRPCGHSVPDLVKVAFQVFLELRDRLPIHYWCTLFALTFSHASQTDCFEISNGLSGAFSSPIRLLPEHFRLIERTTATNNPSLQPYYRAFTATTNRSASTPRDGTHVPRGLPASRHSLSPGHRRQTVSRRAFSCSAWTRQTGIASSTCRTPQGRQVVHVLAYQV